MDLEIDRPLVEEAVFLGIRQAGADGRQELHDILRRAQDVAYSLPEGHREPAFREFYRTAFERLGFEQLLSTVVDEFGLLGEHLSRLRIVKAIRRKAEGADLHVRRTPASEVGAVRTGVVRIMAIRFVEPIELRRWLRPELLQLQDMVDPAFAYRPDLGVDPCDPARRELVRDRYAVLWRAYVAGRLGRSVDPVAFDRAFRSEPPDRREALARFVATSRGLSHEDLLGLARPEQTVPIS